MTQLTEIKNYRILKKLGSGGFGVVYLVEKDRRQYALKKLSESVVNPDISERFIKEALKIEEIRRRNDISCLVRIHEVIFEHKAFVMEYIQEGSVSYFKSRKDHRFLQILVQVVRNLHEIGIVHRDIKPENLRVKDKKPVLIDFGVASWWDSKSNIIPTGTRYYSPPEIVCMFDEYRHAKKAKKANRDLVAIKPDSVMERIKYIKKLHDVYSLGITVGELLTGTLPFNKLSYFEYLDKGTSRDYQKWLAGIPDPFQDFVSRATVFNPRQRSPLTDLYLRSGLADADDGKIVTATLGLPEDSGPWANEASFHCIDCDRSVDAALSSCPQCGALYTTLAMEVDPVQELIIRDSMDQVFKLQAGIGGKKGNLFAVNIRREDFKIRIGRDPERVDVAFPDDNWMSGVHGQIIKRGKQLYYRDGVDGTPPTNPSHFNNVPIGKNEVELLAGAFLLAGSTVFTIRKFMGAVE